MLLSLLQYAILPTRRGPDMMLARSGLAAVRWKAQGTSDGLQPTSDAFQPSVIDMLTKKLQNSSPRLSDVVVLIAGGAVRRRAPLRLLCLGGFRDYGSVLHRRWCGWWAAGLYGGITSRDSLYCC